MIGVLNRTQRILNVKHISNGKRYVIRLIPGLNQIPDETWNIVKTCKFLEELKKNESIAYGKTIDEKLLSDDKVTIPLIGVKPIPPQKPVKSSSV
jgi:hypothetical protein